MLLVTGGPQSWLGSRVWLQGAEAQGAGCEKALTPLKLDLQHVRGVGRGGWITGLRVEPGGGLILPGGGGEKRESRWHWRCQPRQQPQPRCAFPIPKRRAGTAQHRRLPGAPGTKGLEESANFSPQLDLIFSSDAPAAGGGTAAEKQVRQGKAGRWQRAAGWAPARPCAAAGFIRR